MEKPKNLFLYLSYLQIDSNHTRTQPTMPSFVCFFRPISDYLPSFPALRLHFTPKLHDNIFIQVTIQMHLRQFYWKAT